MENWTELIAKRRKVATQAELAQIAGLSKARISQIESQQPADCYARYQGWVDRAEISAVHVDETAVAHALSEVSAALVGGLVRLHTSEDLGDDLERECALCAPLAREALDPTQLEKIARAALDRLLAAEPEPQPLPLAYVLPDLDGLLETLNLTAHGHAILRHLAGEVSRQLAICGAPRVEILRFDFEKTYKKEGVLLGLPDHDPREARCFDLGIWMPVAARVVSQLFTRGAWVPPLPSRGTDGRHRWCKPSTAAVVFDCDPPGAWRVRGGPP